MSTEDTSGNCNKKELSSHFQYQQVTVDGKKYLLGIRKINESRQILLTDLNHFYEEKLSKEDSMKRVEELNPLLPDCDIDEILDDLLLNIPKYITSCTLECIELENKIEDGRFWFHIKLKEAEAQQFLEQHTENLYTSISELFNRYHYLIDLVKKKDREIDEYKAQGVSIVKNSLITDSFNEKLFEKTLKNVKPVDKINVFLETMGFFNTIIKSKLREDLQKTQPIVAEAERTSSVLDLPSTNKKIAAKRPPSSNIRCAIIPTIGKKMKLPKKNSFLKQI